MRASPRTKIRVAVAGPLAGLLLLAGVLVAAPASAVATGFAFAPAFGKVGDSITLTATAPSTFQGVTSVTFNGVAATLGGGTSGASITVNVPAGATDGVIRVVDTGTTLTSASSFNVTNAPTVTAVSPVCGNAGALVTFTGTDLDATSSVTFGATPAVVGAKTATSVQATVPALGPGLVDVTIANGVLPAAVTKFYVGTCTQTISSLTPSSGPVGTTVTIAGANLPTSGTCTVYFADKAATGLPSGSAGTAITTVVPAGAVTGQVRLFCSTGAAAASTNFTVTAVPSITSFTPTSGAAGTVVTITGANFTGATAVKFNNVAATTFTINSATQITATVPAGASTGKISVTTSAGTGTSTANFTVIGGVEHERRVTLTLTKHIRAEGKLSLPDGGPKECKADQTIRLQKMKKDGSWKTIEKIATKSGGAYSAHLPDRTGKYRARAPEVILASGDVCLADASPKQKHHH